MTEDEIMEGLRALARERSQRDPGQTWDRLTAGELTEEERRLLVDEAGDDADVLTELFTPLGDAFEDELTRDLLAQGPGAERPSEEDSLPPAVSTGTSVEDVLAEAPQPANTRRPWYLALVPVIAVAAALLLWFAVPRTTGPADLPDYTWTVQGGDQELRGTPSQPAEGARILASGSSITLSARPDVAADIPVSATVFVVRGGEVVASEAAVDVAPSGAVRWQGTSGEQPLVGDVTEVILVVHPADADAASVRALAVDGGPAVHRVPVALR